MTRNTFNETWVGPERTIEVIEREPAEDRIALYDHRGNPLRIFRNPPTRVGFTPNPLQANARKR